MTSDLIIQIVGSKADLGEVQRAVELEEAYQKIVEWTEPQVRPDGAGFQFSLYDEDEGVMGGLGSHAASANLDELSSAGTSSSAATGPPLGVEAPGSRAARWGAVAVTEVSAKDDVGIEDVFLVLTRRLVLRKAEIDALKARRSRDSVLVDPSATARPLGPGPVDHTSRPGWCCS